ncbi:MAG TPA: hypothetical protein VME01_12015 [Solirubrobacteraceae bacterium]|nr:hypothetical protein [Solirubrobacteraceae bacterium]
MTCADTAGNPIGATGWTEASNAPYVYSQTACSTPGAALQIAVGPNPGGYGDGQGGTLTYTVPSPLSISAYQLNLSNYARSCTIQADGCADGYGHVWLNHQGQIDPAYDFQTLGGTAPGGTFGADDLSGVQSVTLGAACTAPTGTPCDADALIASATITSGVFWLSDPSVPTVSDVGGTLTGPGPLTGTQDITFTATDTASGVYSGIVKVDGTTVTEQVLDANGGLCHDSGQIPGERSFTSPQPCPTQASATLQLNTAALSDGQHHLQVLVDTPAGNQATVYDGTITTDNRTTISSTEPRQRPASTPAGPSGPAPCNAVCDPAPKLTGATLARDALARARSVARSGLTLTGRLTTHTGSPIAGAQLQLVQQAAALGQSPRIIQTATTTATGAWSFRVPVGPSRTLTVTYREHLSDTTAQATLTYREAVAAPVLLRGPRRARVGQRILFEGSLPGGYIPADGELVAMQIFYSGQWRTIDLVRTTPAGRFAYSYQFAGVPAAAYRFRAEVPASAAYPYAANHSPTTTITVQ